MNNKSIEKLFETRLEKDLVKHFFFTHFQLVSLFGPLHSLALIEWDGGIESNEEYAALFFLGAIWGLSRFTAT